MTETQAAGRDPETLGVAHAGEILTLQRAAYVTEALAHNDLGLPPLHQTLGELQTELAAPDVLALGIRERGRLVAAVRLQHDAGVLQLGRLTVAPDRQGHGLGTALLRAAETAVPAATEITLFTGEHSAANIRLYRRLGYRECRRTAAGDYQLVHFVKPLTTVPAAPPHQARSR